MNEIEPDLNHCITGLAWRDPEFAAALMRRIIAMTRINIYPMSEEEITELVDRLGDADLPPIETIPWEELSHRLADKLSDSSLVERVREFEPFEAFLLLCATEITTRSRRCVSPQIDASAFFSVED
jgi:hypothetical protein